MQASVSKTEPRFSIITIYRFGDESSLDRTIASIECQTLPPSELILVLSNAVSFNRDINLKTCDIKVLINEDNGIYDAMNLGLDLVSCTHVFFLNGGDKFHDERSAQYIMRAVEAAPTHVHIFQTLQTFGDTQFLRPTRKELFSGKFCPPHQGFVAPMAAVGETRFDQSRFPIAADAHWMKAVSLRANNLFHETVVAEFFLGGISNSPSLRTVSIRYHEAGVRRAVKEVVKLILFNILGAKAYYSCTFRGKQKIKQCSFLEP